MSPLILVDISLSLHSMQSLLSVAQIVKWFFYLFQAIFYDDYCYDWWYWDNNFFSLLFYFHFHMRNVYAYLLYIVFFISHQSPQSSYCISLSALFSISLYRFHCQTKLTIVETEFFFRSQNCKSTVHNI